MAEGTRWKLTDEKLARHDEMLADLLNSQQEVKNIQVGIQGILELILDRLGALERGPAGQNIGIGLLSNPAQDVRKRHPPTPILPPKWELPQFEGHEPKVWIRKCERYFMQYRIIDENRVETAALYLNGSAEVWYHSLVLSRGVVNWVDFKEELISRFGEILVEDVVE
ncbi:hypothetical protein T459_34428 [Capsicum annuum]|uniref:Retrotransposon gag domain-containing protein n=1 Tax=Capsicum annuum TaxID=4072 RepID=A0A2G2XW10_CAPAN|nr:hypothetical protein T459_34428 [Capsicum annuum]